LKSKGYNPAFDLDLKFGEVWEHKLHDLLTEKGKVEVKTDRMAHKTGNIVIEFESRGKPSGIATTGADYWMYWIENSGIGIFIPTDKLREIVGTCRVVRGGDDNTSRMYLVPLQSIYSII
jgi:hypothetical protein